MGEVELDRRVDFHHVGEEGGTAWSGWRGCGAARRREWVKVKTEDETRNQRAGTT